MRALLLVLLLLPVAAVAQSRQPSHCIAIAGSAPGIAYLQPAALAEDAVRIGYVGHAMFLIETAAGTRAITDYTGQGATGLAPDVVTMNNAHDTHWTPFPEPGIPHVLEGWADRDGPRDWHLELPDLLVRNVHTDTRGYGGIRKDGNSIFVFEAAGLCIGHLGHLHHMPDAAQLAALGRLDVVMAAVDGGLTLDLPTMIDLLERLRASVVIPMHWFSRGSLDRFLIGMADEFDIDRRGPGAIEVSLRTLPSRPTVVVLNPVQPAR